VFAAGGGAITLSGKVIAHGIAVNAATTGITLNGTNDPSLTITAGGITADQSLTINSQVKIGAPQTWNVASGKSVSINGDLHTIISKLTLRGSGDVYLSGKIDGGGVANQAGATRGPIEVKDQIWFILTGGGQSYTPTASVDSGAIIAFALPEGTSSTFSGVISGAGGVQNWSGTGILSGANTYTGTTLISGGALRANLGTSGTPANNINYNSFLSLNGGVLENRGTTATTFTRTLGTSGANKFNWTDQGGGFSAGDAAFTIKVNNGTSSITWGAAVGSGIRGTLKFNSLTSNNVVTFQNAINLNGAERTIQVTDNPSSASDWAVISGKFTGGTTGGINKTGNGLLVLTGTGSSYGDSYGDAGRTIITEGTLQAASTIIPAASCIQLDGGVFQSSGTYTRGWYDELYVNNMTWNNGGFAAKGGKLTVNVDNDNRTVTWTGNGHNGIGGTMVLNSAFADSEVEMTNPINLNGATREVRVNDNPNSNGDIASLSGIISNGGLSKTGPGVLYLKGSAANTYTGTTTVSGGILALQKTSNVVAVPGNLTIADSGYVCAVNAGQIAATSNVNFSGTQAGHLLLYGNTVTVASLSSTSGGTVANNAGIGGMGNGTLVINNAADDYYNGVILNNVSGSGTVALTKTGGGRLFLGGSSANTNTGLTTVSNGLLALQKTSGYAISGNIAIDSGIICVLNPNQIVPTSAVSFTGAQAGALLLYGNTVTVTSLSSTSGGNVGNTAGAVGPGNGTLVVNNASNCSYYGAIYNNVAGGTGLTAVTKTGAGTLFLYGNNANNFTGGLTINQGIVDFENTENDVAHPYTVNSGGHLVLNGVQLAAAASAMSLIAASETDDYASAVPDTNNGTMSIVGSSYFNARNLAGTGTLMVQDNAVVYAHSLVQDTLVIGGTSSFSPAAAVPEPGTMMLLAFAALALAGVGIRRK
jgi:autotransporter-associated beta strand protein